MSDFYLISNRTSEYSSKMEVCTECDTFSFKFQYRDKLNNNLACYECQAVLASIDVDYESYSRPYYLNFDKFSIKVSYQPIYLPILSFIYAHYDRSKVDCRYEINVGEIVTPLIINGVEYTPDELTLTYSHVETSHESEGIYHSVTEIPSELTCCYNCKFSESLGTESQSMKCELLKSILSVQHNIYRSKDNKFDNLEYLPFISRDFSETHSQELEHKCYVDYLNHCDNFVNKNL